jgi:hypothetical protein
MGTIIEFPTRPQDIGVNYYGLELFVESCCKLLDTLPLETRHTTKDEFNRFSRTADSVHGRMPRGAQQRIERPRAARFGGRSFCWRDANQGSLKREPDLVIAQQR